MNLENLDDEGLCEQYIKRWESMTTVFNELKRRGYKYFFECDDSDDTLKEVTLIGKATEFTYYTDDECNELITIKHWFFISKEPFKVLVQTYHWGKLLYWNIHDAIEL